MIAPQTRLGDCHTCGRLTLKGRTYCRTCSPYRRVARPCVTCGKTMMLSLSVAEKKKTCSKDCSSHRRSSTQLGAKSHRWQGGKTSQNRLMRNSVCVHIWRRAVFARDDYRCLACGTRSRDLTADHILPWSLFPAFRFDVENGRTLCRPCHRALPTTGGPLFRLTKAVGEYASDASDPRIFGLFAALASPPGLMRSSETIMLIANDRMHA